MPPAARGRRPARRRPLRRRSRRRRSRARRMPTSRRRSSRPTHTRRGAAPDFGRRLRAPRIERGTHGGDSRPDEDLRSSRIDASVEAGRLGVGRWVGACLAAANERATAVICAIDAALTSLFSGGAAPGCVVCEVRPATEIGRPIDSFELVSLQPAALTSCHTGSGRCLCGSRDHSSARAASCSRHVGRSYSQPSGGASVPSRSYPNPRPAANVQPVIPSRGRQWAQIRFPLEGCSAWITTQSRSRSSYL